MKSGYYINRFFAIIILLHCFILADAQSNFRYDAELITPSTDSWNMIKYGSVGANLYTGTINLSIPFYTYKDKDFIIPISFDYSSNGLMPNLKAGILGPDWNLNVGGTITVDIKGIPDYDGDQFGNFTFFDLSKTSYNRDISKIFRFSQEYSNPNTGMYAPYMLYCPNGLPYSAGNKYDAEPDLYHFNFMGYSGSFHRGYGDTTYVYNTNTNNQDFRIQFAQDFSYIHINTADGYKYEFNTTSGNSDLVNSDDDRRLRVAWKLTRIVAPNGRSVNFYYVDYLSSDFSPASLSLSGTIACLTRNGVEFTGIGKSWEHHIIGNNKTNLTLCSIVIDNGPSIHFTHTQLSSSQGDEYAPLSDPLANPILESQRLTGIQVLSPDSTILKECSLTYKNNNIGKRINYLATVNISGEGAFQMDYYNWNNSSRPFPGNGTLSVDHWGYYNGKNNSNSTLIPFLKLGYINNGLLVITSNSREADATYAKTGMLEKITYPTGGYSLFDYESHDYSIAFKRNTEQEMLSESGVCGGLRIKSICNYNSLDKLSDSKRFEYTNGGSSSGILLYFPFYYIEYSASTDYSDELNIQHYSSGFNTYGSTHIEYSKVTEFHGDGSKIEYCFSNSAISLPYQDVISLINVIKEPYRFLDNGLQFISEWTISNYAICRYTAPITSKQAERGKLLEKKTFSASNMSIPLFDEVNTYNTNKELSVDYLPSYLVRKLGYYTKYIDNYKLSGKTTTDKRNGTDITSQEKNNYNPHGQLVRVATRDSKGDSLITKYQYVKDLSAGQITPSSVYRYMLDSNIISYPLSEMVYIKKGGSGSETLISGKRYTYVNPVASNKAIVRLSMVELYDNTTFSWYTEIEYTSFDSKGNILESKNRNGIYTSYVWGYNGLYLVAKAVNLGLQDLKNSSSTLSGISTTPLTGCVSTSVQSSVRAAKPNAQITFYEYLPFVGMSKMIDPSGKVTQYQYNSKGKLYQIKDGNSVLHNEYFYSPDNKL